MRFKQQEQFVHYNKIFKSLKTRMNNLKLSFPDTSKK